MTKGNLLEVPGLVGSAALLPFSKSNRKAFLRSAGDFITAVQDLPHAVKEATSGIVSAENLDAFTSSVVDLLHGVRDIPHAAANGAKAVVNMENYDAFAKSLVDFAKAVRELPGALGEGLDDLSQAPTDIATAFQKLPAQLTKASGEFMSQYNKYIPEGTDGRKILDSIFLSLPTSNLPLRFSGQRIGDAVENACPILLNAFIQQKSAEDAKEVEKAQRQKRGEAVGELEAFSKSSSLGRRVKLN
ncbi:hypothetical protein DCS_04243 [Drechmeria coniospora]|uniref:Uncharacterized protein n=1 Tax=Drechmeria coniospora TaxID=98403 RepID=A0A151GJH2_DRECN|nr:hypothetical protein DCS_04243 [Drechmeria coniospora]KYK57236.1 hypothetical protein DCS_04243 [Drechmeria coniospora]